MTCTTCMHVIKLATGSKPLTAHFPYPLHFNLPWEGIIIFSVKHKI